MAGQSDGSAEKDIRFFCGSAGAGKSYQLRQAIKRDAPKRVVVWDPDEEYGEAVNAVRVASARDAARLVPRRYDRPIRVAVQANQPAEFERVCQLVWAMADARGPLAYVVDELAGVTGTAKARDTWHTIVTRARKYRLSVWAGAQAPAEVDKTIIRQRSYLWVGALERPQDHRYLSDETGIPREQLEQLVPYQAIEKRAGQPYKKTGRKKRASR